MSAILNCIKLCCRLPTVRLISETVFYKTNVKCLYGRTFAWPARIPIFVTRRNADDQRSNSKYYILLSGLLSFFKKEESEPESELILTMKRSVLLIQRGEVEKAEQMLHLALKMAQQLQNSDAVTYVYDLMANLAYETGQLDKAELLFVSVMQRLLSTGTPNGDNKVVHISLKVADIFKQKHEPRKAENGFKFCMENLEKKIDAGVDDEDTLALWGMTLDWFGRFLLEEKRAKEALRCFQKAYQMSLRVNGVNHEQTVVLLNDLGTVAFLCGDDDAAIRYLNQAVEVGGRLPEMPDFAAVRVNLGAIYMKKQMYDEARRSCESAWKDATGHDNKQGMDEANTCLDEIKKVISSKK